MRNVLVLDDHLVTASGIAKLIADHDGLDVVSICTSTNDALAAIDRLQKNIQVIVADLYIPGEPTGSAIQRLHDYLPDTRIICLTASEGVHDDRLARGYGAHIVIHKSSNPLEVVKACLSNQETLPANDNATTNTVFTSRQTDILKHIAHGKADKEIALELGISPETVRTHLKKLFRTTQTNSRQKLIIWLRENGFRYDR